MDEVTGAGAEDIPTDGPPATEPPQRPPGARGGYAFALTAAGTLALFFVLASIGDRQAESQQRIFFQLTPLANALRGWGEFTFAWIASNTFTIALATTGA